MASFDDIINKRKKEWNCGDLMDGAMKSRGEKIPFSSPLLNYSTYGGIPRNKITEFCGVPSGGKSTTAVDLCKNAYKIFKAEHEEQLEKLLKESSSSKASKMAYEELKERGPKRVLYIDLEHSFDSAWAKTLGIKPEEIELMQPPDVVGESILQTVLELIETGEVGLIVLDSIPSLVPRAELEKKLGERTVAALAGLLTVFCRKLVPILTRYETTMLFINQIRDNMDNPYVLKTPGGEAVKFYSSLRIQFQLGNPVDFLGNELPKSAEDPSGVIVNAKIIKQKSAPNDRKTGSYYLIYNSGVRLDMDYAQLAMKRFGLILKGGAWFTLVDPTTGEILQEDGKEVKVNGMARVYEYLQSHEEYFAKMRTYIDKSINGEEIEDDGGEANQIL